MEFWGNRNYAPSMLLYRLAPAQRQYGAFYGISNGLMSAAPLVLGAAIALGDGWGWWGLSVATVALALLIRVVAREPEADGVAESSARL